MDLIRREKPTATVEEHQEQEEADRSDKRGLQVLQMREPGMEGCRNRVVHKPRDAFFAPHGCSKILTPL
jgi:hypothetical protein